VNNAEHEKH
jgi:hypothetical protein